jgi:uncharacterized protein (DUF2062 family)
MPHRYIWKQIKDFFVHRVLRVDDTPHRIALGVAIGIFVTWTPTVGFQMALAVMLAWLLRANKLVGVPFVWISNPLTLAPIFLPNYYIGRWILGSDVPPPDFGKMVQSPGGWLERVDTWWSVTWQAFLPLWIGGLLMGGALGTLAYFVTYQAIMVYRRKKHDFQRKRIDRMHRRHESRSTTDGATPSDADATAEDDQRQENADKLGSVDQS